MADSLYEGLVVITGEITPVMVWDRALSPDEHRQLFLRASNV